MSDAMDFYADVDLDIKSIKDVSDIYLLEVDGIYFNELDSLQIIYVIYGEIKIFLDGDYKIFKKGELILLNQFENKFIYSDTENLLLFMKISNKYLKNLGEYYYTSRFENLIIEENIKNNIIKNMISIYRLEQVDEEVYLNNIYQIIQDLVRGNICPHCSFTNIEEKSYYLERSIQYVKEKKNILESKNISLNEISEELHLSISYISKLFAEFTGIKFSEFLQQIKLYYSTTYLINSKDTIESIAYLVGFESTKSLNRVFSKYLDITPSEYRKKYNKKFKKDINFKEVEDLFNKFEMQNYGEYVKKLGDKRNNYKINFKTKEEFNIFKNWRIIRNLNSLGDNYLDTLDKLLKEVKIEEIILLFSIDENNGALKLKHLNKEIREYDLNSLFSKCIENDINPVISIDLGDVVFGENIDEILENNINKITKLYDLISNAVGITYMKKFTYLINISDITKYLEDEEKLNKYFEYIKMQQRLLEEKLETKDYIWGYEIGKISKDKIKEIEKLTEKIQKEDFKFKPSVFSLSYIKEDILEMTTLSDLEIIKKSLDDDINRLSKIADKYKFKTNKVYVKDLFADVDISDVNYLYKDLFIVTLIMESLFSYDKDINYVIEYKLIDKMQENGYYMPRYKDKSGFLTPVFWISLILDSIKGKIIYKEPGCFATKNESDLYILLYSDIVTDYSFASKNGLKDLSKRTKKINVNIKGLKGKYKIVTQRLSFEHGTPGYFLKYFDNYIYLSSIEKEYIKRVAVPSIDISLREIEDEYNEEILVSPFNGVLIKYIKV